jgi:hypothetical protein
VRAGGLLLLIAVAGAGAACGATPIGPSSSDFTTLLPDGRYLFTVNALAGRAGCTPAWPPDVGAARAAVLVLRREGDEWVARADRTFDEGLELRLYSTGGTHVAGAIRGTLVTSVVPGPGGIGDAIGLGASFGSLASGGRFVSGDLPFGSSGHGRIEGTTAFIDRERETMTCPEAEWAITPVQPMPAAWRAIAVVDSP